MLSKFKKFFLPAAFFFLTSCSQKEQRTENTPIDGDVSIDISKGIMPLDVSPADIIYFPADFPLLKMKKARQEQPWARIIYSRPHKKGRSLFGSDERSLCTYGKPWRLGANEATELELFKGVSVDDKTILPGRYTLYCIPDSLQWTMAINGNIYNWGLDIDSSKDILRKTVPVEITSLKLEDFTMYFQRQKADVEIVMAWDSIRVRLPLSFIE